MKRKLFKTLCFASALTLSISFISFAGEWANQLGPKQYIKDDGSLAVSEWIWEDENWYHFDENAYVQKGWILDADGKWYFSRYDGVMQTGLIKVSNEVFFMDDSGALFEGEKEIYGNIYKFTVNGVVGNQPGVLQSNIFGSTGIQSFDSGGSSSSSSESSGTETPGESNNPLEPGITTGPGN